MGITYSRNSTIPALNLPSEVVALILDYAVVSLKAEHMCREVFNLPHVASLLFECRVTPSISSGVCLAIPMKVSRELLASYRPVPAPHGIILDWTAIAAITVQRRPRGFFGWDDELGVDAPICSACGYKLVRTINMPDLTHLASEHIMNEVEVEATVGGRGIIDLSKVRAQTCTIAVGDSSTVALPIGASLKVVRGDDYVIIPVDDDTAVTVLASTGLAAPAGSSVGLAPGETMVVRDDMLPLEMRAEAV